MQQPFALNIHLAEWRHFWPPPPPPHFMDGNMALLFPFSLQMDIDIFFPSSAIRKHRTFVSQNGGEGENFSTPLQIVSIMGFGGGVISACAKKNKFLSQTRLKGSGASDSEVLKLLCSFLPPRRPFIFLPLAFFPSFSRRRRNLHEKSIPWK